MQFLRTLLSFILLVSEMLKIERFKAEVGVLNELVFINKKCGALKDIFENVQFF